MTDKTIVPNFRDVQFSRRGVVTICHGVVAMPKETPSERGCHTNYWGNAMEQLTKKLEEFFDAFDTDEAIDISAYKAELTALLSDCASEYDQMTKKVSGLQKVEEGNTELRRIIANDCRAKWILLNDADADAKAEELEALPLEKLHAERAAVLKRFDSKFSLTESGGTVESSPQDRALINLQAFQS